MTNVGARGLAMSAICARQNLYSLALPFPALTSSVTLCCRYPACSMTDVAARELATVSISDYGEDDEAPYSSRFDPWIDQPQVEPTVIKQQS